MKDIKAVLKVFQTGAITITAPSVQNVQIAVERIYPLVYEYRKAKPPQHKKDSQKTDNNVAKGRQKSTKVIIDHEFTDSGSELIDEEALESLGDSSDENIDEDNYSDKSD